MIRFRKPWSRDPEDRSPGLAAPEMGEIAAPSVEFAEASRVSQTFRALRHRNYRLYYAGQSVSLSGTWMQTIAQSWLVLQITDSKTALGTVTMLQFLPITFLVLFAGVIADRVPKRKFIMFTMSLAAGQAFVLGFLVSTGLVELWMVYILAATLGLANALEQPTRQAFIVELVGKEDLLNAVALNSGMFNGARLIGPAIGGVLIAVVGVEAAFWINGFSFLPVIAGLLMMDPRNFHMQNVADKGRVDAIGELKEGVSFALRTPATLLIVILIATLGTFGYNFIVVLPLLAKYVLDGGADQLGFLTAAVGLGALISALLLASRSHATKFTLFVGAISFTALLGTVALSHWFLVTLPLLFALGLANTTFAATANTSLQVATPDHLRGRVMSLWMFLVAGSTPIGGFLTGFLADRIGVQEAIGINAVACAVGTGLGFLYYATHRQEIKQTSDASQVSGTLAREGA
ncbi:MAG TPA: MFS transporter [Dehalococcoidia bacterium]|nr:MFS transporter [Dehalococcoidia bacterium]